MRRLTHEGRLEWTTQSFSNLSHLSDEADHTCRHLGRGRAAAATIRCLIRCAEEERKEWEDKVGKEGEGGEILELSNAQTCHVHLTRRMTQSSDRHLAISHEEPV